MKLNRNTKPATEKSSQNAKIKRIEVIEQVRINVFESFCICGRCKYGDYSNLCRSNKYIADTCNTLKVESQTGKIGTWQSNSVKNLFSHYKTDFPNQGGLSHLLP